MSTKAYYPRAEIGPGQVGFSKTRSIIEAPFYGNNVIKVNTLKEAYELAKNSPGTVVTDMPVYRGEEFGLEPDAKVLLFNDGSITGRYAPARRITGKEVPAKVEPRRAGDPSVLIASNHKAAEVLGYSGAQTFCRIVLPQVVKRILPSITNEVITLVKDTSLAFSIGVIEMFSVAKQLVASQVSMMPFAIAAAFYWVFNLLIDMLAGRLERRLDYYHD